MTHAGLQHITYDIHAEQKCAAGNLEYIKSYVFLKAQGKSCLLQFIPLSIFQIFYHAIELLLFQ